MTKATLHEVSGIPSDYLAKKLTELKKWGYLDSKQKGNQVIWWTIRNESTQYIFNLQSTVSGKDRAVRFTWDNRELRTVGEIAGILNKEFEDKKEDLLPFTVFILRALKGRADLQNECIATEEPTPEQMRRMIDVRIIREERKLKFVRAVLNENVFWKDEPDVAKSIGGRTDRTARLANAEAYKEAKKLFEGRKIVEHTKEKTKGITKEDLRGCLPGTRFKLSEDKKMYKDVTGGLDGDDFKWYHVPSWALDADGNVIPSKLT
jgi:hypothetical protein